MKRRVDQEYIAYAEFCAEEREKLNLEMRESFWGDSISENFVKQSIPRLTTVAAISKEYSKYSRNRALKNIALKIADDAESALQALQAIGDCCIKLGNSRAELDAYLRGAVELTAQLSQIRSGGADIDCQYVELMLLLLHNVGELSRLTLNFELCQDLVPLLERIASAEEEYTEELRYIGRGLGC